MSLSAHAGPRWLVDRDTEISLLANLSRRWVSDHHREQRMGCARRSFGVACRQRDDGQCVQVDPEPPSVSTARKYLDGWTVQPLALAAHGFRYRLCERMQGIGYAKEYTESDKWRNSSRSIRNGCPG